MMKVVGILFVYILIIANGCSRSEDKTIASVEPIIEKSKRFEAKNERFEFGQEPESQERHKTIKNKRFEAKNERFEFGQEPEPQERYETIIGEDFIGVTFIIRNIPQFIYIYLLPNHRYFDLVKACLSYINNNLAIRICIDHERNIINVVSVDLERRSMQIINCLLESNHEICQGELQGIFDEFYNVFEAEIERRIREAVIETQSI